MTVDIVVQPWILRLTLWILLGTLVVLVATIVMARLARRGQARAVDRRLGPLREDVLAVVSGDDEGGSASGSPRCGAARRTSSNRCSSGT